MAVPKIKSRDVIASVAKIQYALTATGIQDLVQLVADLGNHNYSRYIIYTKISKEVYFMLEVT